MFRKIAQRTHNILCVFMLYILCIYSNAILSMNYNMWFISYIKCYTVQCRRANYTIVTMIIAFYCQKVLKCGNNCFAFL